MKTKLVCLLLAVLMLVSLASCAAKEKEEPKTASTAETVETATADQKDEAVASGLWKDALYQEDTILGKGKKEVKVEVEADGKSVTFTLKTDAETLGDALLETKLVEGEDGAYGLYIKKVNGILADYDVDQTYWSFCQNGEALMYGVSDAKIQGGESYQLLRTK